MSVASDLRNAAKRFVRPSAIPIAVALSLACLGSSSAFAGPGAAANAPELTPENIAAFFEAAFPVQNKDHEMVGAVVAVVHDGEVAFERGYGWADLERRVPASPRESLFRVASITKPFVWTAIMQLLEQGRVDLEADVNEYLDFEIPPTYDEPIRLRHLLTHTPGFEESAIGGSVRRAEEILPLGAYLAARMPARVRRPGVHASYSNYGAALAGYIVERVTGQSWSDYVDEHILTPLEMHSTNTHAVMAPELQARHARSYRFEAGRFVGTDYIYLQDSPAGRISATADDMAHFMLAHLNLGEYKGERILSAETARRMQSPLFDPHPGIAPMLHGFYRSESNGMVAFGHGGDTNQFHSDMRLLPEANLGVFMSFNSDPASSARSNLIAAFIDHFFPVDYLRPAPEAADVDLSEYEGVYIPVRSNSSSFERLGILIANGRITAGEGELIFSGGGSTSRWIPTAPDEFVARYADTNMVFDRDESGVVTHVIIGSPLATLRRARGLDSPTVIRGLFATSALLALGALVGWGYRVFRRASDSTALPRIDVALAWLHALLILALLLNLVQTLTGDVEEFQFSVPTIAHVNLLMSDANALLGVVVVALAGRQWISGAGGVLARSRYSLFAFGALINIWLGIYFNFWSYALAAL